MNLLLDIFDHFVWLFLQKNNVIIKLSQRLNNASSHKGNYPTWKSIIGSEIRKTEIEICIRCFIKVEHLKASKSSINI